MAHLRITTLVENTALKKEHLAEHGLSFWIEIGNRKILFDTGQGNVISHNAEVFGIPLEETDAIVLSHGHYDHTGGLGEVWKLATKAVIFAHPDAFSHKYSRHADGTVHEIGMPISDRYKTEHNVNKGPVEVCKGLHLSGAVPRLTDFEDTGGMFFLDGTCEKIDPLNDDQAAFIETSSGTVVISGCAHSGIINILDYVRSLTRNKPIHTVIGGMHLLSASDKRMSRTLAELRKFGLKQLLPAHCTGFAATAALCREFPGVCRPCNVGTIVDMEI